MSSGVNKLHSVLFNGVKEKMSKPNVILTGFMGTGKTTIGHMLTQELGYEFVDTDELIQARAGQSIAEIFSEKGEEAFRQMEAAVVRELAAKEGLVISTGGRLMLDATNAAVLGRKGRVFCLVATPEEIMDRVSKDTGARRPLLEVPDPLERIAELMRQREEKYNRFTQIMTTDRLPQTVTKNIAGIIQADPDLQVPIIAPNMRYDFIVGSGLLPFVKQLAGIDGPVAVVTDSQIGAMYAQSCGPVDLVVKVPPGANHKTLATAQTIFNQLNKAGFDRSGSIIALGGSVISELAGFVAAVYMRGVDCIQCPTSLLAMVDTSIGGKTGVDLPPGKNLIGVFKQPKAVIVDMDTLQTLPPREFAFGMAEIIKHSIIADSDLLSSIEKGNWKRQPEEFQALLSVLQSVIIRAIQIKINIVQEDPFDRGRRNVLNLGHTFANSIEQTSGYGIRHGEAVAIGLVAAANLSARLGHCSSLLQQRIEAVLAHVKLPFRIPGNLNSDQLFKAMSSDKKKKTGRLRFVLLRDIGEVFVTDDVTKKAVLETIEELTL